MGAALHSSITECLDPNENVTDQNDATTDKPTVEDMVGRPALAEINSNTVKTKKVRVQAADEIHYGSAGSVPKGATGVELGKFEGNGRPFIFVNWDAFPELGRVSVQPENVVPMLDDRPGTYVITHEAGVTLSMALAKDVVAILPVGTTVSIVEVVHCQEEKRWRGRVEAPVKGWISLLASNDGTRWVEQPSAGGYSAGNPSGAASIQRATAASFQEDAARHGLQRNYAGTIFSSSRPCAVAPSEAGAFHHPVQAQAPRSRGNVSGETYSTTASLLGSVGGERHASCLQYSQTLETPTTFAALSAAPGVLSRDDVLLQEASRSNQPLNARTEAVRRVSTPSQWEKRNTSPGPELLSVLQDVREQLKGIADKITDNASDAQVSVL